MKKKVTICGKEYDICTNAFCMFEYKKQFKSGLIADISKMNNYNKRINEIEEQGKKEGLSEEAIERKSNQIAMEEFDNIIQVPLQLAYIFIKTANRNFMSFEDWLMTIDNIQAEDGWIGEVTELAVSSFLGQGAGTTTEIIENNEK